MISFPLSIIFASLGVYGMPMLVIPESKNIETGSGNAPTGVVPLDLTRHETPIDKHILQDHLLVNIPGDGTSILTDISNQVTHYSVKIGIGQSNIVYPVLVDTGSSDFWVSNDTSLVEVPFNYALDSAQTLLEEPFHIDYVRGSADGYWTSNKVFLGHEIKNMSYAVVYRGINSPKIRGSSGILGISYSHGNRPSLCEKLKQDGYINKNAFSLSLTEYKGNSGSLLFGGVDHSRYIGDLLTVPRANHQDPTVKSLSVALTSVTVDGVTISTSGEVAPLDSGTTFTYVPPRIYDQLAAAFGIDSSNSVAFGAPAFNVTKYGDKEVTFEFSGAKIKVKGKDMALSFKDFSRPDHGDMKIFGIWSNVYSAGYTILGDTFLKSAYVVYDLDGETISLAQSNPTPGLPNIEPILNDIPGARMAIRIN